MSGQPVLEYAEDRLIDYYRDVFWPTKDRHEADQLFAWLHAFNDSMISRKDTVAPLFTSVFCSGQQSGRMQMAAMVIFGVHHTEPWLYRRMTHHALSFVGQMLGVHGTKESFKAFVLTVKQQLPVRLNYTVRNVYDEIEQRKRKADETVVITKKPRAKPSGKPKMVDCSLCHKPTPEATAHIHQGLWIGDKCCWDEALRTTE